METNIKTDNHNHIFEIAEILAAAVSIPLLHIADATAQVLQRQGIACVGLLGTRFTMEQAFYQLARKTSYF